MEIRIFRHCQVILVIVMEIKGADTEFSGYIA